MPGPDITDPKNRRAPRIALFPRCVIWAVVAVLAQPFAGHAESKASQLRSEAVQSQSDQTQPAQSQPAQSQPAQSQTTQSPSGSTPAPPPRSTPQQNPNENGTFVIRKDVDEVLLHASVVDEKQRIVTNLDKSAFTVYEDGKPQHIISFHHEDIPVAMGIVIDNSGSMREKRAKVNQAALNLVRSSNPQDEVFVVNFND